MWRDVIESMPHFSSRFVIFVGSNATLLPDIKSQISRTEDLPLDVLVRSKGKLSLEEEAAQASSVMKILSPVVPRCRSFVFDVEHSSSLSVISKNFRGLAEHLRVLKLACRALFLPRSLWMVTHLWMPASSHRGRTNSANRVLIACPSTVSPPDPEEVDDEGYEGYDLYKLCQCLSNIGYIRHLTLENIWIAYEDGTADTSGYEQALKWDNNTLTGNDQEFVMEFIIATSASLPYRFYHLSGTNLDYDSIPRAYHLRLEDIPNVNTQTFCHALERYAGHCLDIVDCKEFSDVHLQEIVKNCISLRRLCLINCPNITIKGLRVMIKSRSELVSESDHPDDGGDHETVVEGTFNVDAAIEAVYCNRSWGRPNRYKPIHRLQVEGHTGTLSQADKRWFKKHVES